MTSPQSSKLVQTLNTTIRNKPRGVLHITKAMYEAIYADPDAVHDLDYADASMQSETYCGWPIVIVDNQASPWTVQRAKNELDDSNTAPNAPAVLEKKTSTRKKVSTQKKGKHHG